MDCSESRKDIGNLHWYILHSEGLIRGRLSIKILGRLLLQS